MDNIFIYVISTVSSVEEIEATYFVILINSSQPKINSKNK